MTDLRTTIRLHVPGVMAAGAECVLDPAQRHYLWRVMRCTQGDELRVFNRENGEWLARVHALGRNDGRVVCVRQTRPPAAPPDLWLLFAPLKRPRTGHVVEKACELGCRRILPVLSDRTTSRRVAVARLQAHATAAAEQCGLLSVPEVAAPEHLATLLDRWPAGRRMLFCDERGTARPALAELAAAAAGPWAVLVGPEGGFTAPEARRLVAHPAVLPVSLGPRLLRADTAAVAALTLWQAVLGDWRD